MIRQTFQKVYSLIHCYAENHSKNQDIAVLSRDTILASFPKSGNTWVRFLIANLYNEIENSLAEIDFLNIHEIIPELGKGRNFRFPNFSKILKTHQQYDKKFNRVILILRNPYDVLYSYFKYLKGEKKLDVSLSEVIHHDKFGIQSLVDHTNSYIRNCTDLHLVTYEQLKSHPSKYFGNIARYLGIDYTDEHIANAISRSSFSSMRKIEETKGRRYGRKEFIFVRRGKIGEGFSRIDWYDRKYISESIRRCPIMNLLYE